ncbi:phosphate ABC transporter permease subunit PstC [Alteromonas sediminis]|uniref:Phosphate transport system permease protein n=1 Tax=Alteromonas sediminis TaxID=2259342 RepID=A0A3N5XZD1_9ALTE|nr:phosphate ABC transporter permease subunit PstC [Alteromonas sediminis]RPJ65863.1 phosphate ABC transporter permease subunit PstC [Alteromonas sediminis]
MDTSMLLVVGLLMIAVAYFAGRTRSISLASGVGGVKNLNSLPFYYGALTALWCGIPSFILLAIWLIFDDFFIAQIIVQTLPDHVKDMSDAELGLLMDTVANVAQNSTMGLSTEPHILQAAERLSALQQTNQMAMTVAFLSAGIILMLAAWLKIHTSMRARVHVELAFKWVLLGCACIAIFTTIGIVLSVLFESLKFFQAVPFTDFVFGMEWSPQMAIRSDQVGGSGAFGAIPLFAGTMLISMIAMLIAVPAGLMAAIYLAEYAHPKVRNIIKPVLEVLAGVPTVVYGFFAALTVAPFLRDSGAIIGLDVSSESALAAGLVMGVMIIPFVSSLSDDVITAVPQSLRDGSFGLGATQSETIKKVVIPAALPGIVGGVLLAVSRAIGETMIVVMAAGLAAHLTANPLESVTTVTVQIVKLLVGDQEFNSPKTLSAFALGLMLFTVTLILNFIALQVVKKYREQYE